MNKYLTKIAVRLDLYEDKKKKQKWIAEGKTVPKGFKFIKTTYKKKKNNAPPVKVQGR